MFLRPLAPTLAPTLAHTQVAAVVLDAAAGAGLLDIVLQHRDRFGRTAVSICYEGQPN